MSDRFWAKVVNRLATVSLWLEAHQFKSLKWHEEKWVITLKHSSFSQQPLARCPVVVGGDTDTIHASLWWFQSGCSLLLWCKKARIWLWNLAYLDSFLCFYFLLGWRCVMPMTGSLTRTLKIFTCSISAPLMQTRVCLCLLFFSIINNELLGFADVKQ